MGNCFSNTTQTTVKVPNPHSENRVAQPSTSNWSIRPGDKSHPPVSQGSNSAPREETSIPSNSANATTTTSTEIKYDPNTSRNSKPYTPPPPVPSSSANNDNNNKHTNNNKNKLKPSKPKQSIIAVKHNSKQKEAFVPPYNPNQELPKNKSEDGLLLFTPPLYKSPNASSAEFIEEEDDFPEEPVDIPPKQHPPRLLKTTNPRKSVDPRLEKSVRTIQLNFEEVYFQGEQLGFGAFATVFAATHIDTKTEYAVKKIDREKMIWSDRNALEDEIKNLTRVRDGPNIVQLFEVYEEGAFCLLVMEYLKGGELFDRIIQKTRYNEREARDACRCMLNALNYMHKRRVCHRDLKPENLLLVTRNDDTTLKLADFGFAKKLETENSCRTLCGTPGYLAPEILERWPAYDVTCDIWSVGVILFLLIGGYLPFDSDDDDEVFENTRNGTFSFHPAYFKTASDEVKDLIGGMLTLNPFRRLTAAKALESTWMKQGDEDLEKRNLTRNLGKMGESFRAQKTVKGAITAVIMTNRLGKLSADFNHYLQKKGRQESLLSRASEITKGAIIQDDESTTGLPFNTFYDVGDKLGEGGFAAVYRVTHKKTQKMYAVKDVRREALEAGDLEALKQEINSLKLLRNGPHIIRLYDVFDEPEHTYLVLELMKGGELLQRIVDKEVYSEREARQVCKILFEAVDYMHKKQIAHRDLKPENILLVEKNNDTTIKIADFGFAKRVMKKNGLRTLCGTPAYAAPEVLSLRSSGYGTKCDMWSTGVIVYVLLGGYMPFEGELEEMAPLILAGSYEFHAPYWDPISSSAKDLVRNLMQVDPDIRFSAEQALQSKWMTVAGATLARRDLSFTQSNIGDKFKGAVKAIMVTNKLSELLHIPDTIKEEPSEDETDAKKVKDSTSGKPFLDLYDWGTRIGEGSFSVVHESIEKQTGKTFAAKRVKRRLLDENDAIALQDEITALRAVKGNKYICEFHDVFEEPDYTFLVLEIFRGGDLITKVIQKSTYSEQEARTVCRSLLKGVEYMHSKDIAHRNLKPDNVFLVSPESDVDIKICDFGFAKKVLYPNSLRTQCGTEGYVAPEVLEHHPAYDRQCDMWSLGVVFYILLGGYRPFRGSGDVLMRQIRYGEYEFHGKYWGHVSEEATDLIESLLTVDPNKRATATEALQSKWMKLRDGPLKETSLESNLSKLKDDFDPKTKLRGAVKTIIMAQKLNSLGNHF